MKRKTMFLGVTLAVGLGVGILGTSALNAQPELAKGTVLQRTDLAGIKGKEAMLVIRDLPPGAESGKHYQSGNEIAFVLEGSLSLEVAGKPPVMLKRGDAFQTRPKEVHNVKNTSATAPSRVLVFYITEKGKSLADISIPAK